MAERIARSELILGGQKSGKSRRAEMLAHDAPGIRFLADLSANLMRDLDVAVGAAMRVALPPGALRVFPGRAPIAEEDA